MPNEHPIVVIRTLEELRALRHWRGPREFTLVLHVAELAAGLEQLRGTLIGGSGRIPAGQGETIEPVPATPATER